LVHPWFPLSPKEGGGGNRIQILVDGFSHSYSFPGVSRETVHREKGDQAINPKQAMIG
jgi:hypothetical protein